MGYVGLPLAVEFGKSRPVVGFDINLARIAELQSGKDSTLEVTSEELVAAKHLAYSNRLEDIADCGVFIVTVPTPIDKANRPDLTPLVKASETVGKAMKAGSVVIYESTVYPGCTEEVCVPVLEKHLRPQIQQGFLLRLQPGAHQPGRQGQYADQDQEDHQWLHAGSRQGSGRALRQHHHCRHLSGHQPEGRRSSQGHREHPARPEHRFGQ